MNILKIEKKIAVLHALVEGNSIRSTSRMTGVHKKTIMRLLLDAGGQCQRLLDSRMRGLSCRLLQCDEIWTFVQKKEKRIRPGQEAIGSQYIYVALDPETKLVPCFRVGKRNYENTWYFIRDLERRMAHRRVQITTDGWGAYIGSIEDAFGSQVDFAQLIKTYEHDESKRERYSPSDIVNVIPSTISGNPDPAHVCTSHVERSNLTIRMHLRRFTRLTNGFSKKRSNLAAAVSLYVVWYNFCRVHSTLRVTPAMQAGLSDHIWTLEEALTI